MRLYWAAGFFDEAQSDFNLKCARRLRAAGHSVFLPQELDLNDPHAEPDSVSIFHADKAELAAADALIAVIDGEAIDAGVATEIGLAASLDKRVYGLLTDLRANRSGEGRIYRNLFTIGLIRESGGLHLDMDELVDSLDQSEASEPGAGLSELGARSFLSRLEASYHPKWSVFGELVSHLKTTSGPIIDMGCGVGSLLSELRAVEMENHYFGFDVDRSCLDGFDQALLGDGSAAVGVDIGDYPTTFEGPRTLVLSFVVHELQDPQKILLDALDKLQPQQFLAYDITVRDLPRLSRILLDLYPPSVPVIDCRRTIDELPIWLTAAGYHLTSLVNIELDVRFGTAKDLAAYVHHFSLLSGKDMPVGEVMNRSRIYNAIERFDFPWEDRRVFRHVTAVRAES